MENNLPYKLIARDIIYKYKYNNGINFRYVLILEIVYDGYSDFKVL
jgi:hypothetical protein